MGSPFCLFIDPRVSAAGWLFGGATSLSNGRKSYKYSNAYLALHAGLQYCIASEIISRTRRLLTDSLPVQVSERNFYYYVLRSPYIAK